MSNKSVVMLKMTSHSLQVVLRMESANHVALYQLSRREIAAIHGLLHLINRGLVELEAVAIGHGKQVVRPSIFLQWEIARSVPKLRFRRKHLAQQKGGNHRKIGVHGGEKAKRDERLEEQRL